MRTNENAFTLIELVVTLSLISIFIGLAVANLPQMINPAQTGAVELSSFLKKARARAVSTTSAVFVTAADTGLVEGRSARNCDSGPGIEDNKLALILPENVSITDLGWSICFDARGFASVDETIPLEDIYDGEQSVEVYLGGAVRVNS
jgi:prepilin-type N-terminal cleavage/methylation domain-containing protein